MRVATPQVEAASFVLNLYNLISFVDHDKACRHDHYAALYDFLKRVCNPPFRIDGVRTS